MGIEYLQQKKKETERKDCRWTCKTFFSWTLGFSSYTRTIMGIVFSILFF